MAWAIANDVAAFVSNCVWIALDTPFKKSNSVLDTLPPDILAASIPVPKFNVISLPLITELIFVPPNTDKPPPNGTETVELPSVLIVNDELESLSLPIEPAYLLAAIAPANWSFLIVPVKLDVA